MPRLILLCTLWLAVLSLTETAHAQTFTLDNSHTSVIFSIAHMQFSYTYGRFNDVKGSFTVNTADPSASTFQFTINASTVDTNDKKRDDHLRGPDFFNVKQFPIITFQSTSVAPGGDGMLNVTGDLTMHGVTNQVTLPMKQLGMGQGPMGKTRTGFFLKTNLKRSDYGMSGMLPMIGDDVSITISFEGVQ